MSVERLDESVGEERRAGPRRNRRDVPRAEALARMAEVLADASLDYATVVQLVVELVSEFLGDVAVLRLLSDDESDLPVAAVHATDPELLALARPVIEALPHDRDRAKPYGRAIERGRAQTVPIAQVSDAAKALGPVHRRALDELDIAWVLIAPLRVRGATIGTLGLWRRAGRPAFTERDEAFVQDLADRSALAIANARLIASLQRELADRRRAEQSLRLSLEMLTRSDEKRQALVASLVKAQEEERRRIASDVHDDSIQAMSAVAIRLQILRRMVTDPSLSEAMTALEDTVSSSVRRLRQLLFRLNPSQVETEGLARAVLVFLQQVFPSGTPAFRIQDTLAKEPSHGVRVIAYRIAQEALVNIQKHAEATHIEVSLSEVDGGCLVSIRDDGRGFDVEEARTRSMPGHLGLRSMRERATAAGGWHTVDSTAGVGTLVRFWIPAVGE